MQTQGYTTINFDFQSLQIPNDRIDLIESANKLRDFAKNAVKNVKKMSSKTNKEKEKEKLMSFAGAFSGIFDDITINEMRQNKALRK